MPLISVLVPFRGDGGHRDRAWSWCRRRLESILTDFEVIPGRSSDGPFNPSAAVNDAASRARCEVFIVHDAEIALPAEWYAEALRDLRTWTIPAGVRYLTEMSSAALLRQPPATAELPWDAPAEQEVEHCVGGVIVLTREMFEATGGKDERFGGWGPEDGAWATALDTLVGAPRRFGGPMIHLWHPRPWDDRERPWPDGAGELLGRYRAAEGNPEAMREVCAR